MEDSPEAGEGILDAGFSESFSANQVAKVFRYRNPELRVPAHNVVDSHGFDIEEVGVACRLSGASPDILSILAAD